MIIKFINGSKEEKVNIKEKRKRKLGDEGGGTTFFLSHILFPHRF